MTEHAPVPEHTLIFSHKLTAAINDTTRCPCCRGALAIYIQHTGPHAGRWAVVQTHSAPCPAAQATT